MPTYEQLVPTYYIIILHIFTKYVGIFMPFNTYFKASITYFFFVDFTKESTAISYHWPTIMHPALKSMLSPTKYIIYDAPLGCLHPQTGQYIDICIHIETPLDVSIKQSG